MDWPTRMWFGAFLKMLDVSKVTYFICVHAGLPPRA